MTDCDADLSVRRDPNANDWDYTFNAESWVNGTAVNLASQLAGAAIQTLVFTPANRHYPFSNAQKTILSQSTISGLPRLPEILDSLKTLAEYELGISSAVFAELARGVAVHTSLTLEVEKIASELAFKRGCVPLMYATGTLAQGLNLPAIAVVIAGTRIGDPRGQSHEVVEQRKLSQLLNAAGRAGRAGFANQGVVITIPDKPIVFNDFEDILTARNTLGFLQHSDNAVFVGSGLDWFLDQVCNQRLRTDSASDLELQVFALLTGDNGADANPKAVLEHTFAAFRRRQASRPPPSDAAVSKLLTVRDDFMAATKAPEWLPLAAQRSGLSFLLTLCLFRSWAVVRTAWDKAPELWDVRDWLSELLSVVPLIPPGLISQYLAPEMLERINSNFKFSETQKKNLFLARSASWKPPSNWLNAWSSVEEPLLLWMRGEPITAIAANLSNSALSAVKSDRGQGKPLPKALSVVSETWSALAILAGGFLAVVEQHFSGTVPLPLACLPMCIKYGCDSPGTMAWYRFGIRLRRPSRLLSRLMPPPDHLKSDVELRDWVKERRRLWLNGTIAFGALVTEDEARVIEATKRFIQS